MTQLISFWTEKFDVTKERPNPINPIAGESVLHWLREVVFGPNHLATEPDSEDWGWYMDVTDKHGSYMIGSIAYSKENTKTGDRLEWRLQVHKSRTLMEKIRGKNKLECTEPIVLKIIQALEQDAAFEDVVREADV